MGGGTRTDLGRISDRRVDAGNLIVGGSTGATLLSTIVSLDPIQFVFDASEADFIRYLRLAAAGARPSSRDVQNPVAVRLADESDFTHQGAWISSTMRSIRRQAPCAAAPCSTIRMVC
jgi:hypothetical protein